MLLERGDIGIMLVLCKNVFLYGTDSPPTSLMDISLTYFCHESTFVMMTQTTVSILFFKKFYF